MQRSQHVLQTSGWQIDLDPPRAEGSAKQWWWVPLQPVPAAAQVTNSRPTPQAMVPDATTSMQAPASPTSTDEAMLPRPPHPVASARHSDTGETLKAPRAVVHQGTKPLVMPAMHDPAINAVEAELQLLRDSYRPHSHPGLPRRPPVALSVPLRAPLTTLPTPQPSLSSPFPPSILPRLSSQAELAAMGTGATIEESSATHVGDAEFSRGPSPAMFKPPPAHEPLAVSATERDVRVWSSAARAAWAPAPDGSAQHPQAESQWALWGRLFGPPTTTPLPSGPPSLPQTKRCRLSHEAGQAM